MATDDNTTDQDGSDPLKGIFSALSNMAKGSGSNQGTDGFVKILLAFFSLLVGGDPGEQNFGNAPENTDGKQGDYQKSVTDYYKKPGNLTAVPEKLSEMRKAYHMPELNAPDAKGQKTTIEAISPVAGNVRISSEFGEREAPKEGASTEHKGLDIAPLTKGEKLDIVAPMPGVVVAAGWKKGYGNTIDIMDINGTTHRFGHLDHFTAKVGDQVEQGEQIAVMGMTGNATGVHLHYEQRDASGKPVDPVLLARTFKNEDRITLDENRQFLALQQQKEGPGTQVADARPGARPELDALLAQANFSQPSADYVSPVTGSRGQTRQGPVVGG